MKFQTGSKNDVKLNAWLQVHVLDCPKWDIINAGELPQVTYTFTPTQEGLVIKVRCSCGEEEDITDYDEWQT